MRKIILSQILVLMAFVAKSQSVGIGTTSPSGSAMLDVASTSKGLLIPRMNSGQRTGIPSPANGLMVYDITTKSNWYFDTQWKELATVGTTDSSFLNMQNAALLYNMSHGLLVTDSAGFIFDSGGSGGGYGNNEDITMGIIFPPGSQFCRITIVSLLTEAPFDSLGISGGGKSYNFTGNISNQSVYFNYSLEPILLHFKTNASSTQNGFQLKFDHFFVKPAVTSNLTSTLTGFYYIPEKVAVRGGLQSNNTWHKDSVGLNSFAFGNGPKAKGNYSFASGLNTSAPGIGSAATGGLTTAAGDFSTAAGYATNAGGKYATAAGFGTIARGYASTVVGVFNDSIIAPNETTVSPATPLFIVGNGDNLGARNNALVVKKNGAVGIANNFPDTDAILDIASTNRGVLLPRLTLANRNLIPTPPIGLTIYQTDNIIGYYFWNGSAWDKLQDDLGNHTLSENLVTGTNYISREDISPSRGIQMLANGGVRIVTVNNNTTPGPPAERFKLDVDGGFVAKGILGIGVIPTTGAGERMMWHPNKAAFRAGSIGSSGTQWDDPNVGYYSTALGYNTIALALASFAEGYQSQALGSYSTAMGYTAIADGTGAVAIGYRATADADYSVAIGQRANTNGHAGSLVLSDGSTTDSTEASANNQFMARYAGGYRFFTNATQTVGAQMGAGASSWGAISDVKRKENFEAAVPERFLEKLGKLNIGSWNYKGQDPKEFRHYGPMAQEIFAAYGKDKYGIIGCDTLLYSADMDGIMMIMLQGLEKRTKQQDNIIETLTQENARLEARLLKIEAMLKK